MGMGIQVEVEGCDDAFNDSIDSSESRKAKLRLFIKEMVMRNFKSYAGEKRVGPFHKSFTAVVGPNGSGKSNVIDAMLFVFGKRAKQKRKEPLPELNPMGGTWELREV